MNERDQFAAFVDQHARSLQRSAWLLTSDWQAAEDLVQSALLTAWQTWGDVRDPAARVSYVRQVIFRAFLKSRRRRWTDEISTGWQPEPATADAYTAVDTRDPLLRAIRDLPAAQRAVVVLRYFDDQSERVTADVLGCSVGTVKSHASRALATLRSRPELQDHRNEEAL